MYDSSHQGYFWMGGMLVGLAVGGAALYAASRAASAGRGVQAMAAATAVIPVLALAIGSAYV